MNNLRIRIVPDPNPKSPRLAEVEIDLSATMPGLKITGISIWRAESGKAKDLKIVLPQRPRGNTPEEFLRNTGPGDAVEQLKAAIRDEYLFSVGVWRKIPCPACGHENREPESTCVECGGVLPPAKPVKTA